MISPTYGKLSLEETADKILEFINKQEGFYKFIIGSDSQVYSRSVIFITALIVHREGNGGIYFYRKTILNRRISFAERMFTEASYSLEFASKFLKVINKKLINFQDYISDFEIHVDVGKNGKSRELINSVVGMIKGSGYTVKYKPESYGASKIADKHTKLLIKNELKHTF